MTRSSLLSSSSEAGPLRAVGGGGGAAAGVTQPDLRGRRIPFTSESCIDDVGLF